MMNMREAGSARARMEETSSMYENMRKWLHTLQTRRNNTRTVEELEIQLRGAGDIILVHQMGRAGSMTTVNTLRASGVSTPVFHCHWLNQETIRQRMAWLDGKKDSLQPLNIRVSRRIAEELNTAGTGRRRWKLVSVFREPIGRNVSAFFLSIQVFVEDFFQRYPRGELSNEQLLSAFLEKFPHDEPLEWFDREVRDVFGLDVYEHEFDPDQGYRVIRHGNTDLLLIKLETLNSCYRDAFGDFLGVDVSDLKQTHVTEADPAYSMYKDFAQQLKLPRHYVDRMCQSRYMKHFYSSTERDALLRRWST
jgi:hypothetical protein